MKRSLIIFMLSFLSIDCLLENKKDLNLSLSGLDQAYLGKKSTILVSLYQEIEPYESFKDFSRKPCFKSDILDNNSKKKYTLDCGIWKDNDYFMNKVDVFCDINETVPAGNYTLLLDEVKPFDYKDYKVNIHPREGPQYLNFEKYDKDVIDLYSDEQTITLEEGKENYEVKFNIVSYHQENLHFEYNNIVDNCTVQQNNILVCPLTKKFLLQFINPEDNKITIWSLNSISNQVQDLKFVPTIKVVVPEMQKKHIYVEIKKLLSNASSLDAAIAYETNVTEISNYYNFGPVFKLTFINKDNQGKEEENENRCRFNKYDNNPLMIICWTDIEGTSWLKETREEKLLEESYQYIYHLLPINNNEKIETVGAGTYVFWHYPNILDFTKNNDTLSIDIDIREPKYYKGVTFNEDEEDLKCEEFGDKIIRCKVPKSHFKGKKSGDYFIKRNNHLKKKFASYENFPIKVILPSKGNIISSSLFYSLLLLIMI